MDNYATDDTGYKDRYVAFLDILGFSQLTEKADTHPNWRAWLRDCIGALKKTVPATEMHSGIRFVQFSDSIVMSADRTPTGLQTVLWGVEILYRNMLARGILLRGGIAAGNFHHDEHLMFGPALIRAYAFEQRGAPPHISLHDDVIEDMQPSLTNPDGAMKWLARDPWDGTPMVDVLIDFASYTPDPRPGFEILDFEAARLAEMIEQRASHEDLASARSKWRWMQHYWNESVGRTGILQRSLPGIDWDEVRRRTEYVVSVWNKCSEPPEAPPVDNARAVYANDWAVPPPNDEQSG